MFKIQLFHIACVLSLLTDLNAQSNLFDNSFGQAGQTLVNIGQVNDLINDLAILPDKSILVLGETYNGSNMTGAMAKFSANGQLDPSFGNQGKLISNNIGSSGRLLAQSDGKFLIGYSKNSGASNADFAVCRFLPNGVPDSSFATFGVSAHDFFGGYDYLQDMILLPDGKILCAGSTDQNGEEKMALMLLDTNGVLDTGFGSQGAKTIDLAPGNEQIQAIAAFDGNHFIAAGRSKKNGSNYDFAVCKFSYTGDLDSTFGVNGSQILPVGSGDDQATQAMVLSDHRIIVVGKTGVTVNFNDIALVGLDASGHLLAGFGTNGKVISALSTGDDVPNSLIYLDDQHFLVAAIVNKLPTIASNTDFALLQYRTDGQLDPAFGINGMVQTEFWGLKDEANAAFLTPDNLIYLAGSAINSNGNKDFALARYHLDGQLDISFGYQGKAVADIGQSSDDAYAMTLLPDGSILLSGRETWETSNSTRFALSKLDPSGTIDSTFGQNGRATIGESHKNCFSFGIAVDPVSRKIVQVGSAGVGTTRDFMIARFLKDGKADSTFNGNGKLILPLSAGDDQAQTVQITADGKIVAGGFAVINNNYQLAVIRINSDGTLDSTFGMGGKVFVAPGNLWTVGNTSLLLPDGKLLIGGETAFPSGTNTSIVLVMLQPDGQLEPGFGLSGIIRYNRSNYRDEARKLLRIGGDNSILVAGRTGQSADSDVSIWRFFADGKIDSTFGVNGLNTMILPGTIEQVNDAAFQQGRILVAGFSSITDIYTKRRLFLARFTGEGVIDSTFSNNGLFVPYTNITPDGTQSLTSGAWGVAVQPDKKIILGGSYSVYTNSDMLAIRLYPGLISSQTNVSNVLKLRIYPNPVVDWFDLQLERKGDFKVSLFNSTGQMVQFWSIHSDTQSGRLSQTLSLNPQLPAGRYALSVENKDVKWAGNLIKK